MLNPRALSVALGFLCLAACQTTPPVDVQPEFTTQVALAQINPRDVAVLPVEDASPGQAAGPLLEQMREDMEANLVQRRYSPLNTPFVDAAADGRAEGSGSILAADYLSRVAEGFDGDTAVLALRLNRWDESGLLSRARVGFTAEAVLVAGSSGTVLWSGQLSGSIKAGGEGPAPLDPVERSRSVATLFIQQLILNLPMRRL